MLIYRLEEHIACPSFAFDKGDLVCAETMERIMTEYYEVKFTIIRLM